MEKIKFLLSFYLPEEQLWFESWYKRYKRTGDPSYDNGSWVNEKECEVPKGIIYLMDLVIKNKY